MWELVELICDEGGNLNKYRELVKTLLLNALYTNRKIQLKNLDWNYEEMISELISECSLVIAKYVDFVWKILDLKRKAKGCGNAGYIRRLEVVSLNLTKRILDEFSSVGGSYLSRNLDGNANAAGEDGKDEDGGKKKKRGRKCISIDSVMKSRDGESKFGFRRKLEKKMSMTDNRISWIDLSEVLNSVLNCVREEQAAPRLRTRQVYFTAAILMCYICFEDWRGKVDSWIQTYQNCDKYILMSEKHLRDLSIELCKCYESQLDFDCICEAFKNVGNKNNLPILEDNASLGTLKNFWTTIRKRIENCLFKNYQC